MKQWLFFQLILSFFLATPSLMALQDKSTEKDGVTVRGKIIQGSEDKTFHVELSDFKVKFLKRIVLPPAPVPEDWAKMKPADQEAWWNNFLESDAGKDYMTKREELLKSGEEFEAPVEADGSFVLYDITPGTYGLTARVDKKIGPRTYAFEMFGEIPVGEESDIIELGEKQLVITPIIRTGEPASEWSEATNLSGDEVTLQTFQGKYVLLNFWSSDDPSRDFQNDIQAAYNKLKEKHPFELLSVSLDAKKDALVKFVQDNKLQGVHVHTSRDSEIAKAFGVHSTPGLLLIDPEGVIKMTYPEMIQAFQSGKPTLDVILDDRINGKDIPERETTDPNAGIKK